MGTPILFHTPAEIMQHLLVGLSLGTLPSTGGAWPIEILTKGSRPDSVIVIYNTTGLLQSRENVTGQKHKRYGIQIAILALVPSIAGAKASAIEDALDKSVKRTQVTVAATTEQPQAGTYRVHSFSRTSPVLDAGKESPASSRRLYTINGTVAITNIT